MFGRFSVLVFIPLPLAARSSTTGASSVFPNGDLDPLCSETLTQSRTLNNTRELFGGKDLEDVAEYAGKNGGRAGVEGLWGGGRPDVYEVHFESAAG